VVGGIEGQIVGRQPLAADLTVFILLKSNVGMGMPTYSGQVASQTTSFFKKGFRISVMVEKFVW
jgi:hypothetical protein